MESINIACSSSNINLSHSEIIENATIIEEGIRLCPLCRSEVRLLFINFNEKILMCENVECEYPFGHEDVIYMKENNEAQSDEEVASIRNKPIRTSPTATYSMISTTAWSDIDKINKAYESEDQFDKPDNKQTESWKLKQLEDAKKEEEIKQQMLKEVEALRQLNVELVREEPDGLPNIRNEKWIKNLMELQETSGVSLLTPSEMKLVKKKQPDIGSGELKIDIDVGDTSTMSSIKIAITNNSPKNT